MSELILRNVDASILDRLSQKASVHGVSVEEEAKKILHEAVQPTSSTPVLERTRAIRERNAPLQKTNTLELLREDRDRR